MMVFRVSLVVSPLFLNIIFATNTDNNKGLKYNEKILNMRKLHLYMYNSTLTSSKFTNYFTKTHNIVLLFIYIRYILFFCLIIGEYQI